MIGATEKIGKNNLDANKLLLRPNIVCLRRAKKAGRMLVRLSGNDSFYFYSHLLLRKASIC